MLTVEQIALLRIADASPRLVIPRQYTRNDLGVGGKLHQRATGSTLAAIQLSTLGLLTTVGGNEYKDEYAITEAGREAIAANAN